jgi:hypothetical protein
MPSAAVSARMWAAAPAMIGGVLATSLFASCRIIGRPLGAYARCGGSGIVGRTGHRVHIGRMSRLGEGARARVWMTTKLCWGKTVSGLQGEIGPVIRASSSGVAATRAPFV